MERIAIFFALWGLFCSVLVGSPTVKASDFEDKDPIKDSIDYFAMDLAELMELNVFAITKSDIRIQRSPGIVRVFSNEDFKKYELFTLSDLLAQVPGVQLQNYRHGHQLIWTRGMQSRFNSKTLLVIDGVPIINQTHGHFDPHVYSLENVERVEVINGPGSVLYGTNAFAGVISITTKKNTNKETPSGSARVMVGTNKTWGFDDNNEYTKLNALSYSAIGSVNHNGFFIGAEYHFTDGFNPEFERRGKKYEHEQQQEVKSLQLGYRKTLFAEDELSLSARLDAYSYFGTTEKAYRDYKREKMPIYGSVSYKKQFGTSGDLKIQLSHVNYSSRQIESKFKDESDDGSETYAPYQKMLNSRSFADKTTSVTLGNIDYNVDIKKNKILAGISFQNDQSNDSLPKTDAGVFLNEKAYDTEAQLIKPANRNTLGIYLQDVWEINEHFIATGAIRYDVLSDFENQFNYRAGFTAMSSSNVYGKLLYGRAYRVPTYREYLFKGTENSQLNPEYVNTLELQAGYLMSDLGDVNLTFFSNQYSDFIDEIRAYITEDRSDSDEIFVNFDKKSIAGLEFSSNLYPLGNLSMNVSLSSLFYAKETKGDAPAYVDPVDPVVSETSDIQFLSNLTASAMVSYKFLKIFNLGLKGIYQSDRPFPEGYQSKVDDMPEVYNTSNMDSFLKLDVSLGAQVTDNLDFSLIVNNASDARIYSPAYLKYENYDTEWVGRKTLLALRYKF